MKGCEGMGTAAVWDILVKFFFDLGTKIRASGRSLHLGKVSRSQRFHVACGLFPRILLRQTP